MTMTDWGVAGVAPIPELHQSLSPGFCSQLLGVVLYISR